MARHECPSPEELFAFHVGTAAPDAFEELAAHVEGCLHCEGALRQLDGSLDPVLAALRRPAPAATTPGPRALVPDDEGDPLKSRESEVRATLRGRLATLLPICGAVWGSLFVVSLTHPAFSQWYIGQPGQALLGLATAASAVGVGLLWARPGLSLPRLRLVEVLSVLLFAAVLLSFRASFLGRVLPAAAAEPDTPNFLLYWRTVFNNFGWLALILFYGVCLPNTRRRATAVVLALALVPLATDAGFALGLPGSLSALIYPLLMTGQMLLVAVGIALFGSYKVETLEAEAYQARQEARAARALGPYVLGRRLGAGGMGEVYLAEHRLLKRPCALKLIHPDRLGDPEARARFDREVQATARLEHPNTVEVFDYGHADDGTFYYVMEYLDGMSLEEEVGRFGPLPPGRVVHILRQVCGALHEAHSAGLVHRDIKPGNVLLCRHGGFHDVVKVVDFGLVRSAVGEGPGRLTRAGAILGTPDYMSPEQADGMNLDFRSDLYSLGAMAFFLLTGRPPFVAETVLGVLLAHRQAPVPQLITPSPIPECLQAVVRRCLAKDAADRPSSADELSDALAGCAVAAPWTEDEAQASWASQCR